MYVCWGATTLSSKLECKVAKAIRYLAAHLPFARPSEVEPSTQRGIDPVDKMAKSTWSICHNGQKIVMGDKFVTKNLHSVGKRHLILGKIESMPSRLFVCLQLPGSTDSKFRFGK